MQIGSRKIFIWNLSVCSCLFVRTIRSKRTDRRSLNAQILVMAIHVFNSQLFLVHAAMISITVSVEFILDFFTALLQQCFLYIYVANIKEV